MHAISPAQTAHFRPWLTIWLHPRRTIQQIVDLNPWHEIYLLVLLSGTASGVGNWLNAVITDADTFLENLPLAVAYTLVIGTAAALAGCLVLQWITVRIGHRIPYSHLAAASFWGTVPEIGFLLLGGVVFGAATLVSPLLSNTIPVGALTDLLLGFAWSASQIWSMVLTIGALAQVMHCSVGAAFARQFGAGMLLLAPVWAMSSLLSYLGDRYSGGGDIVLYERPGVETGATLESIGLPLVVLVVSLVVLFAMYRATHTVNTGELL